MCYVIPGKVVQIEKNIVTVEYFGEKKKAKNDFFKLRLGEYIYAQGGFVIQKIAPRYAKDILKTWHDVFFKLQEVDLRLAQKPSDQRQIANSLRHKYQGNSCCVHAILEFSNYCSGNCLYCGLRKDNGSISRYRMSVNEIVGIACHAVNKLKFKAIVLQSGEDDWYDEAKLKAIVGEIKEKAPALIILSIGERELGLYEKLYAAGARAVLLRFETSNKDIYSKMRPQRKFEDRIELIRKLRNTGFIIMTGFLIGLPGQAQQDIIEDIELMASLGTDMFSFGPFIPHPHTPLNNEKTVSMDTVLDVIARVRIMNPDSKILVTTAVESLDKKYGLRRGLLSGGNSLMIDITPQNYRRLYDIYPSRAGTDSPTAEKIETVIKLLQAIGRAPVDLGI